MAILRLKDENGNIITVPAIVGPPGQKPVKGTDYFTEADKEELVAEVIAKLPVYNGEVMTE